MLTNLGVNVTPQIIEQSGNEITTNEFGMLVGRIHYLDTAASTAYTRRPAQGSAYGGSLREYRGMLADQSRVVRIIGDRALMEVTYLGIDTSFKILPKESADIEYRDITVDLNLASITFEPAPVPHPVLTYRFIAAKRQGKRGTFGLPPNAPDIPDYVYRVHGFLNAAISGVELFDVVFKPSAAGWLCLRDDANPLCGGKFFAIEQQWKRTYFFSNYAKAGS